MWLDAAHLPMGAVIGISVMPLGMRWWLSVPLCALAVYCAAELLR